VAEEPGAARGILAERKVSAAEVSEAKAAFLVLVKETANMANAASPTSLNRCSAGHRARGQDQQAELHLSLTDAATTHPQTFLVNDKNIRITIPAGVDNGQIIKLKGHGGPGSNGGPAGDLYIHFSIGEDPRWRRDGSDLHTTAHIDLYTAVLGGETLVDTLDGKVKLKVKPGTQHGNTMRLKGKGFPVYKEPGKTGDLYVSLEVRLPTDLSEKEKQLFSELSALAKK
jgi:curved DNA-binding protein